MDGKRPCSTPSLRKPEPVQVIARLKEAAEGGNEHAAQILEILSNRNPESAAGPSSDSVSPIPFLLNLARHM